MSLAHFLPTAEMPRAGRKAARKAGRSHAAPRADQIRCVAMLLGGFLGKQAAGAFGVSRMTVYNWRDTLLADGLPDTDGLRRLARNRGIGWPDARRN